MARISRRATQCLLRRMQKRRRAGAAVLDLNERRRQSVIMSGREYEPEGGGIQINGALADIAVCYG